MGQQKVGAWGRKAMGKSCPRQHRRKGGGSGVGVHSPVGGGGQRRRNAREVASSRHAGRRQGEGQPSRQAKWEGAAGKGGKRLTN